MEGHLGVTGGKMKWNISPLKVKDFSAFVATPGTKWTADGRNCNSDTFRSRLHSSPYVNPDNALWSTKENDAPSTESLLLSNSKEIKELLNNNSGSTECGSSRILDGSDSGVVLQPTKFPDNIAISVANLSLDSGMQITQRSTDKLEPSGYSEKGAASFSGVFDPMATPFRPRTTIPTPLENRTLQRSDLKAIDVAKSISSCRKPVTLSDITNKFSNRCVERSDRDGQVTQAWEAVGISDHAHSLFPSSCQNNNRTKCNTKLEINPITKSLNAPVTGGRFIEKNNDLPRSKMLDTENMSSERDFWREDAYWNPLGNFEGIGVLKNERSLSLLTSQSEGMGANNFLGDGGRRCGERKVTFEDMVQAGMRAIKEKSAPNDPFQLNQKVHSCRSAQFMSEAKLSSVSFATEEGRITAEFRPSKYRTEPCTTFHTIGVCPYGARCNFYHEVEEKNDAPTVSKAMRYKTRLCKTWQKAGECPYELRCDFAHGTNDLAPNSPYRPHYKTRMCKVLQQTGRCPYGPQCTFAHKQSELRTDISLIYKYKTEICKAWESGQTCSHGVNCHFAHGAEELKKRSLGSLEF